MRKRRVLEEYVTFITNMLRDRRTKLKFDDFKLDWVDIDNGIGQGDPLSMILYLYYNADLLDVVSSRHQSAVTYVDDANLYAEGNSYDKAYKNLNEMLLKQHSAREWTVTHNSRFEKSKFAVICFLRRRVPDPSWHGKTMPEPRPDFVYEGTHIKLQHHHKFLGVFFDQELRWGVQAEKTLAKAVKWTLLCRRLTKPASGVHLTYMRRLYCVVAIPKITYTTDIWFTLLQRKEGQKRTSGSVGLVCKLTSIQRIATITITGAMCTTATDALEVLADIHPIDLLLSDACHRATLRLASLPETHPLFKPVRTCACRMVKRHPTPLHTLFNTFPVRPAKVEPVIPSLHCLNVAPTFTTEIAETRDESKQVNMEETVDACVYTDGLGIDGMAGAAAVMYKSKQIMSSLRYCLGPLEEHTTYEAEGVGVLLALELLQKERGVRTVSIRLDNQGVIQALSYIRARRGQHILRQAYKVANRISDPSKRWHLELKIGWISGHDDVEGNEEADKEAKLAAEDMSSKP